MFATVHCFEVSERERSERECETTFGTKHLPAARVGHSIVYAGRRGLWVQGAACDGGSGSGWWGVRGGGMQ